MQPINRMLVTFAFVFAALNSMANSYSEVAVNGELLTREQLYVLEVQLRTAIPGGNYLLDGQGCWLNLTTEASGCVGSVGTYLYQGSRELSGDPSRNEYGADAGLGNAATRDG